MSKFNATLPSIKKISAAIAKLPNGICPFPETPSAHTDETTGTNGTGAQQLFSLFTADIMKAKTVFVR